MLCVRIMVEDVARSQSFENGGTPCKYGKMVKKGEKEILLPLSLARQVVASSRIIPAVFISGESEVPG